LASGGLRSGQASCLVVGHVHGVADGSRRGPYGDAHQPKAAPDGGKFGQWGVELPALAHV